MSQRKGRDSMENFDKRKIYLFNTKKYKKDMKKRIKKAMTEYEKEKLRESLRDGLNGFAKELEDNRNTFSLVSDSSHVVGIYTYNGENIFIYPQWCIEVTADELKEKIEKSKRKFGGLK